MARFKSTQCVSYSLRVSGCFTVSVPHGSCGALDGFHMATDCSPYSLPFFLSWHCGSLVIQSSSHSSGWSLHGWCLKHPASISIPFSSFTRQDSPSFISPKGYRPSRQPSNPSSQPTASGAAGESVTPAALVSWSVGGCIAIR